jgi:transcriptional regulator GlxA family with amidase domain
MAITTGILLFDEAEELDWAGPWEILTGAAQGANRGDRVVTIAEHDRPVVCAKGLRVLPDHTLENAPALDVLLIPGGLGTRREAENPVVVDWIRKVAPRCRWITSVCTGALLLDVAGLTEGKRITTHWAFVEKLRETSKAEVLAGVRYVRDGNLVTAAGVSAGIDMALWLVGQIYGVAHARTVQRWVEYDPAPPYAAEV